jgi:hypothetical protein
MTTYIKGLRLSQQISVGHDNSVGIAWISPAIELIGAFSQFDVVNVQFQALGHNLSQSITYHLQAGTFPTGLILNSTTGRLIGTIQDQSNNADFIVRAVSGDVFADKEFRIFVGIPPAPVWVTPAGLIDYGTSTQFVTANLQVKAVDPLGLPISYSITGGFFPPGLTIDTSTGMISGIYPLLSQDQIYTFTVSASNGKSASPQTFIIYVAAAIAPGSDGWVTPAGDVGSAYELTLFDKQFQYVDPGGNAVTFIKLTGDFPSGTDTDQVILNPTTGEMKGTLGEQPDNTVFSFVLGALTSASPFAVPRFFQSTVLHDVPPTFNLPQVPGSDPVVLGSIIELNPFFVLIGVQSNPNLPIVFTETGLPNSITLDIDNGAVISNAMPLVSDASEANLDFGVTISDTIKSTSQTFRIIDLKDLPPTFNIPPFLGSFLGLNAFDTGPNPIAVDQITPNRPVTFAIDTPLPSAVAPGLQFDPNLGRIYGTLPDTTNGNVYVNGVVTASLGALAPISTLPGAHPASLNFSILALKNLPPVWNTPQGDLGAVINGVTLAAGHMAVSASDPNAFQAVTYRLVSDPNAIGDGLMFDNATASIIGTVFSTNTVVDQFFFTVEASYNGILANTRSFSFTVDPNYLPIWDTPPGEITQGLGGTAIVNATVKGHDPNGIPVTYTLGENNLSSSMTFSDGTFSGIWPDTFDADTPYYAVVILSDGVTEVEQTFILTSLVNLPPTWITNAGLLATVNEQSQIFLPLLAVDPEGHSIDYYITETSNLVPGLNQPPNIVVLNSNGVISGNLPPVTANTPFPFTVNAWDQTNDIQDTRIYKQAQSFEIEVVFTEPPLWQTTFNINTLEQNPYSLTLNASRTGNRGYITYSFVSGTLPPGIALSGDTNNILSGTTPAQATTKTYSFVLRADNGTKFSDQTFFFTVNHNLAPVWDTPAGVLFSHLSNTTINLVSLTATDPNGGLSPGLNYGIATRGNVPDSLNLNIDGSGIHLGGKLPFAQSSKSYTFTGKVNDGLSNDVTRTWTIIGLANQPPVWASPAGNIGSVLENSAFTYQFGASDPEGNAITYTLSHSTLPGTLHLLANGLVMGNTPVAITNTDTYNFTVIADDGTPLPIPRNFSLNVNKNYAPFWVTPPGSMGSVLAGTVPTTILQAIDPNGSPLSYSTTGPDPLPDGLGYDPASGAWTTAIDSNLVSAQVFPFQITASDGVFPVAENFSILALPNLPPTFDPPSGSLGSGFEQTPFIAQITATDGNTSNALVIGPVTFDIGLVGWQFDPTTGIITGTLPTVSQNTPFNIVAVANNGVKTTTAHYTVQSLFDQLPSFTGSFTLKQGVEQQPYPVNGTMFITATGGNGSPLTFAATGGNLPDGINVFGNGMVSGIAPTISSSPEDFSFDITVTDGVKSNTSVFTIELVFNEPPIWDTESNLGAVAQGQFSSFAMTAHDVNQLPLTYTLQNGAPPDTMTFSANSTGFYIMGPAPIFSSGQNVVYSFTVGADNGPIRTDRTFTLTVAPDLPPVWVTNAGEIAQAVSHSFFQYTLSATDPYNGSITYSENSAINAFPTWLTLNSSSGQLSGTIPPVFANTVIYFTVDADNGQNAPRNFSILDIYDGEYFDSLANTVLFHMNFDSTPFTDLVGGHTIVPGANGISLPTLTGIAQYGSGAAQFTALSGTQLAIPSNTDTRMNPFFSQPITIEFWINPTNLTQTGTILYTQALQASPSVLEGSYTLQQTGTNLVMSSFTTTSGTTSLSYAIPSMGPIHIALVTRTSPAVGFTWYVNGVSQGFVPGVTYALNAAPIFIGGQGTNSNFWSGTVDDLRITQAQRYLSNFTPKYAPVCPIITGPANSSVVAQGNEGSVFTGTISFAITDPHAANALANFGMVAGNFRTFSVDNSGHYTGLIPASGPTELMAVEAQDTNGNWTRPLILSAISNVVPQAGLVASWRFNHDVGSTVWAPSYGPAGFTTAPIQEAPSFQNAQGMPGYTALQTAQGLGSGHVQAINGNLGTSFTSMFAGDYTMELWIYLPAGANIPTATTFFGIGSAAYHFGNGPSGWGLYSASPAAILPSPMTVGSWTHIAIVKSSGFLQTYKNGVSGTAVAAIAQNLDNTTLCIGDRANFIQEGVNNAQYAAFQWWNSAKYTTNFTPVWPGYPLY